jgi:Septum formation
VVIPIRARLLSCCALVVTVFLTGCSGGGSGIKDISVFTVKPGECFTAPSSVKVQLSTLTKKPCSSEHTQEAYAVVQFAPPGATRATAARPTAIPSLTSSYPGSDVLTTFAQGACAQRYAGYVGVDYLDSSLFFTYLLPSARSWEQADDRDVICFVTTTGSTLTSSVKGSKR